MAAKIKWKLRIFKYSNLFFDVFTYFERGVNQKYKSNVVAFVNKFQNGLNIQKFRKPFSVMKLKTDPQFNNICVSANKGHSVDTNN